VFANLITRGNALKTMDTTLAPQPQLTAFLVERQMPGVHIHSDKVDRKIGLKGLETCPVTFDNVTLTHEHVIGQEGKGAEVLQQTLSSDRLVSSA
jgi:alkylation response protein AidB-like acyl-CoA dehydrogenase